MLRSKGSNKLVFPKNRVTNLITEQARRVRSKWRKVITGDDKKRIRDLLKEKESQPYYIKLFDKFSFTFGVLNIALCQYFLLNIPQYFWLWYSLIVPILLLTRYFHFKSLGWQYFLLDFCYFTVLCTFINLYLLNTSETLFKVLFIYATGPLPTAIVVWRNSLVFHDYDKITSVYIHILPSMLYYSARWYGHSSLTHIKDECFLYPSLNIYDFIYAAIIYVIWQIEYYILTEISYKSELDTSPNLLTSLRWLSSDTKNTLAREVLKICRLLNIFQRNEEYDSKTFKTKLVFMTSQFIYTVITFIIAPVQYYSQTAHLTFIILIFTISLFNGASFYIEVFSSRYQKQLESLKSD